MTEYHVEWKIEVTADNPTEAAMQARMIMLDPESEAVHYEVLPFGEDYVNGSMFEKIDLSDIDFTKVEI
jgi:hypothetical protein